MIEPNKIPAVTINGKEYPVPLLVPRQQREVIPSLIRFTNVLIDLTKMTQESYNDMLKIVFWGALWPNPEMFPDKKPHFERDLLDSNIQWNDLVAAITTIRERTGLFQKESHTVTLDEIGAAISQARALNKIPDNVPTTNLEMGEAISTVVSRKRKEAAIVLGEAQAGA